MAEIDYENIINKGTLYDMDNSRYDKDTIMVSCDRCKRANIKEHIGYEGWDVCIKCVREINGPTGTQMEQFQFKTTNELIIGSLFDTNGKNGSLLDIISTAYQKQTPDDPRLFSKYACTTRMDQYMFR